MKKKLVYSKKSIVLFLLSALIFVLGVLFLIDQLHQFIILDIDLGSILTGAVIIIVGSFILLPLIQRKDNRYSWIFIVEYTLVLIAGVIGFILPGLNSEWGSKLGTPSFWIGLIITFHAASFLITGQYAKKLDNWFFLFMLLLLFLGGFIIGSNILDSWIDWIIVTLFFLASVFLLIKGLAIPKVYKQVKESKENDN